MVRDSAQNIRCLAPVMMGQITPRTVPLEPITILQARPVLSMQTNRSTTNILLLVAIIGLVGVLGMMLVLFPKEPERGANPAPAPTSSPTAQAPGSTEPKLERIVTFPPANEVTSRPVQPTTAIMPIKISASGVSFSSFTSPLRTQYPFQNNAGKSVTLHVTGPKTEETVVENNTVRSIDLSAPGDYTILIKELQQSVTIHIQ